MKKLPPIPIPAGFTQQGCGMIHDMEAPNLIPMTPEQIAALDAGESFVHALDPTTQRRYLLIEQVEPTLDEEYVREKLAEGLASIEAGEVSDWDVEEFKKQLHERHESRSPNS
jgi:hypothetical protein